MGLNHDTASPMPTLDFDLDHDYNSGADVHQALVHVRVFKKDGIPLSLQALLDTGASFCSFDKDVAELIGIDNIESGEARHIAAANVDEGSGDYEIMYLHEVEIEFLGHKMNVPMGFVPTWPSGTQNLLGMKGFFESMHAAFLHGERRFLVTFL